MSPQTRFVIALPESPTSFWYGSGRAQAALEFTVLAETDLEFVVLLVLLVLPPLGSQARATVLSLHPYLFKILLSGKPAT